MTATLAERPAALLGCEQPRIFTPPLRPLTPRTTKGFEVIAFAEDVLGITLHPWQRWALIHGMEILDDGTFRFRTLLVLVARQNGKTTLMLVIALWRMYVDRSPLVIGTAQNLDIAEEAWQAAVDMAQGVPELAEEIDHIDRTNGKKALRLTTGERYKVAAASRRGGRSLSGDLVLLDELREHRNWESWGAVSKTTMARAYAQILGFSNAGDLGSVVLNTLRIKALEVIANVLGSAVDGVKPGGTSGDADDAPGLFDWSAEPECAMDDHEGWAQANPSLGHRGGITERAIRGALGTDPENVFRTEVLCQHVDGMHESVFAPGVWAALADPASLKPTRTAFSVAVTPDRSWAAIGVAGPRADGQIHLEVVDHLPGTEWVVPRLVELCKAYRPDALVLDGGGPAASLLTDLAEAKTVTTETGTRDFVQACGGLYDLVVQGRVRHLPNAELDEAVRVARQRPLSDAWAWARRGPDITCLESVTLAAWAAAKFAPRKARVVNLAEAMSRAETADGDGEPDDRGDSERRS